MSMTREEALQRIEFRVRHSCPDANGDNIGECDGCWRNPCNDMKAVLLLAQDRPHGEWEHWGSPFTDDTIANSIVCSICKARYVEIEGEVFNFCPCCGADMREGDGNGT